MTHVLSCFLFRFRPLDAALTLSPSAITFFENRARIRAPGLHCIYFTIITGPLDLMLLLTLLGVAHVSTLLHVHVLHVIITGITSPFSRR
jgi:hypothetical protein